MMKGAKVDRREGFSMECDVLVIDASGDADVVAMAGLGTFMGAEGKGYRLPRKEIFLFPTPRLGELPCNATRILGRDGRDLNPIYVRDLAGCEQSFPNDTGVQVGVRQTRQIRALSKFANADVLERRKDADGIARSVWPIELHPGEKPRVEWLYDDFCEIPYGCFVPERGDNFLVAGRCLSESMAS